MAPFHSRAPVGHDSVTASQHAQHQDPETEAAKWNSAIINLIIYTCAFPSAACQNVLRAVERTVGLDVAFSFFSTWHTAPRKKRFTMPHVRFLSSSPVLCNLVCFRWCAGDDSCSSSGARAKESSKRWAQLDAEVTTEEWKVALARWVVCVSACFCAGREGLGWGEFMGLVGWKSVCADSLTPADCCVFTFLLFLSLHLHSPDPSERPGSFIVDHKSARSFHGKWKPGTDKGSI